MNADLRRSIRAANRRDERDIIAELAGRAELAPDAAARVSAHAGRLVEAVRAARPAGDIDAFLGEFRLSTQEGVVLMCLAEALLRIPDSATADRLIRDKIGAGDWASHLGRSESAFVNASTWALMLSGRLVRLEEAPAGVLGRLLARAGEPVLREAMATAMRILGRQFVMGRTIAEALDRAGESERHGWRHSFDMLGEAARTRADSRRYFEAYLGAIAAIGRAAAGRGPVDGPGLSVKLSALHPRFEPAQAGRLGGELAPRLLDLCLAAKAADIGLTVDSEEADRLEPMLDMVEAVFADPALAGWEGFGIAVQAYQKRAPAVIAWAADLASAAGRRMTVRLVKGAYWDSEIKRAQERGLDTYPVFTRKAATDTSYLACARDLVAAGRHLRAAFATHNAHTVAAVAELAGPGGDWEYQRLHGMGETLYTPVLGERPCRVYAPVGSHEELLPYLVRRLLENGANTSFVNRLADRSVPVSRMVEDPVAAARSQGTGTIPLPADLYAPERLNSAGIDLADPDRVAALVAAMEQAGQGDFAALPVIGGNQITVGEERVLLDPADLRRIVGTVVEAAPEDAAHAVERARAAWPDWDRLGGEARAAVLERAADLFEQSRPDLLWLAVREAGKTLPDAVAELREAVDFLRYYAARAREQFSRPLDLPGPTGETNRLSLHGRGVFACISPWNFPLAIFTGQVAAALAAGNAVVAKPAEQTPLIAARAIALLHQAGVPAEVLHLLPGDGPMGAALVRAPHLGGVAFTGSTMTARAIARDLAGRGGPILPLVAETGGINAMIVDSSALPEQVVGDVVISAFQSAGQRCSALRLLFLQADLADKVIAMLAGAVDELNVGDPIRLATDVGPVIDPQALEGLERHVRRLRRDGTVVAEGRLGEDCRAGTFLAPVAFRLEAPEGVTEEVFGPVLQIVPFAGDRLDGVMDWLEGCGYGLTLGVHSRIDSVVERICARAPVGNIYVNRSMIGAVVGTQPFGGEGLSGTGPKAGGPHTLLRYATERTVTVNIAAAGGNAALLAGGGEGPADAPPAPSTQVHADLQVLMPNGR
ncbi:bifunctional proline dehydrogenase/L-glutamate gamma-semialdehyde dehydrogenase PutA [Magnetospirillum sp. UT-4]|uniref:bifunctional proline dehydrogenase/L-glutamate gamma-semialdehyde dehydrogenase PutA n=1 Tax=Magnetospirillum sp. UT-4 TaxID=2681467 RepID=UPI001385D6AE|nr:bifunctional proline dehydrogenase/L-glutamate gamma-semialdehyde dehydrogenase PutA [Magnetospirillum sp. UT-4]CAA7615990.1 Bifunctional proline dehydrogenase/pyrroline-5-carboxylate dehydrogenase [Magnetospirillum sp. UT-4]